ncbi:MAG: hypothetical protein U9O82_07655 [Thermodesulfobacteriota bacterium]|nr:hypothetical protein [Thermodesulfobacteriota bacterium]
MLWKRVSNNPAIWVIVLGFVIRLYSFYHSYLFNPDGIKYIQQAKALNFGLYDVLTACYGHLNSLAFFILAAFKITGDWVVAGKAVSIFFGTAVMIPLYLLLRRFLDKSFACCCLLVFAVHPIFVELGSDILRGPVFWFFLTLGLYFFTCHDQKRYFLFLSLSCATFLMALTARFEAIIFIFISPCFLLFAEKEYKWRKISAFVSPLLLILLVALVFFSSYFREIGTIFYPQEIIERLMSAMRRYNELQGSLTVLKDQDPAGLSPFFLSEVRSLLWWLAFGVLLVELARTFFEPFFLIFLLGIPGIKKRLKQDKNLFYLVLLALSAFVMLYVQVLYNWIMTKRFIALFLFPSFVFIGFGLERIVRFLKNRFNMKQTLAYGAVCLLIFVTALPKNLEPNREDKLVFKEIGEFVAAREGNSNEILIAGSFKRVNFIHFYSNLNYRGAPCFDEDEYWIDEKSPVDLKFLRENNFHYFVWDEMHRSAAELEMLKGEGGQGLTEVGEWQARKLGRLIVFRIE